MPFHNVDELAQQLVRLKLVAPDDLEQARAELDYQHETPQALLDVLERRHLLTTYQAGKLAKGETDGLVLGNYKLLYRNAAGSFARVFRGCSLSDGSMIGLKILRQRWVSDPAAVAEFHREAEVCKQLRHKNIVPIYETASENGFHYFTMEFIEGGNLRDFINIRGKVEAAEATKYVLDMAEALEYAISRGITHRDLKPTNVLMSSDGVAKLVDFGLAGCESRVGSRETETMQRALEYAALEKGTGAPRNDPRSDLYFLGAIYYELLTGRPPYPPTKSREERLQLSRYSGVREIRLVEPSLPKCVTDIVARLMQINPNERYQSAQEVVGDLKRALEELDGQPSDENGQDQPKKTAKLPKQRTIMCIETRAKQQNMLREYLSKHGFRVLVLTDVQRGLMRLSNNPPDCIVLMGESLDDIASAFSEAQRLGNPHNVVVVAVLGQQQGDLAETLATTSTARVIAQPATLRDLRREIYVGLQKTRKKRKERGSRKT